MLLSLIYFFLVFVISYSIGLGAIKLLKNGGKEQIAADIVAIVGLLLMSVFLAIISLLLPLGHAITYIIIILLSLPNIANAIYKTRLLTIDFCALASRKITPIILVITVLFISSLSFDKCDAGLYHYQTIIWNKLFGVVTGLGNLHGRLAFNSHQHILDAFFHIELFKSDLIPTNTFFFLLLSIRAYISLVSTDYKKNIFGFTTLLFLFYFGYVYLASPGTDLIPFVICSYLMYIFLFRDIELTVSPYIITILSLCILTFKVSYFPILLIPLSLKYFYNKKIFSLIMISALIMIPFFIRNYIQSGYLVYPIDTIDIFNPKWKVPKTSPYDHSFIVASTSAEIDLIKGGPRQAYGENPAHILAKMSVLEWLPIWIKSSYKDLSKLLSILTILLSPILIFLIQVKRKNSITKLNSIIYISILGLMTWFIQSPEPRFAIGYMTVIITSFLIYFFKASQYFSKIVNFLILFFLVRFTILNILKYQSSITIDTLFIKNSIPQQNFTKKDINNHSLYIPIDSCNCQAIKAPCSPYQNQYLYKLGVSTKEGYYQQNTKNER
jgi:hypothetical protein